MRIGVPAEIKVHEYRVGLTPGFRCRIDRAQGTGSGSNAAPAPASAFRIATTSAPARRSPPDAAAVFRTRRPDRQGQGAATRRVSAAAVGPDPVHLSAPGGGSRPGRCADRLRRKRHCVRNGHCAGRRSAVARADERSRRTDGGAGGREVSRERSRRHRQAARRRAGRGAGEGRHPRRRQRRRERGIDRARYAGRRDDTRQVREPAALARRSVRCGRCEW